MIQLSKVLSWINLIIASIITIGGLMAVMAAPGAMAALLGVILVGSIILHSYAALQLRKSLMNPAIPLDSKTPTGIRFIGFLAMFFAIMNIFNAFIIIRNAPELMQELSLPPEAQSIATESFFRAIGYFTLIFSISVAVNVNINFILLRKYLQREKYNESE